MFLLKIQCKWMIAWLDEIIFTLYLSENIFLKFKYGCNNTSICFFIVKKYYLKACWIISNNVVFIYDIEYDTQRKYRDAVLGEQETFLVLFSMLCFDTKTISLPDFKNTLSYATKTFIHKTSCYWNSSLYSILNYAYL